MQDHALDPEVYIRSMASRGHLGGLSWTTPQALRVLDAAGYDIVLIETVGVGQSEVEVAGLADTTVVLLAPGMGDGIQAAKAGILEIGDVFVVNKADREGADATVRDLRHMISLGDRTEPGLWRPPVVKTVAARNEGVDEVIEAIDKHTDWLTRTGNLRVRREARAGDEIEAIVLAALRRRMGNLRHHDSVDRLAADVVDGRTDPYAAADQVLDALT
jgi:LAO/AO transport system kinase